MHDFDDATAITMQTYQYIAGIYAETHKQADAPAFWTERLQRFASILRANLAYQSNPTLPILDIGCGPGRDALFLAQMNFDVLAADLSEAMLEEARKRWANFPGAERITFRQMDMRALDLPAASCAGILASASFLHIPKRENLAVLQEFRRVLAAGGPLLLLVKECDNGEAERYELHLQSGLTRFFARYRGSELWNLLERAGFMVIEITTDRDRRFTDLQRWLGALATKG